MFAMPSAFSKTRILFPANSLRSAPHSDTNCASTVTLATTTSDIARVNNAFIIVDSKVFNINKTALLLFFLSLKAAVELDDHLTNYFSAFIAKTIRPRLTTTAKDVGRSTCLRTETCDELSDFQDSALDPIYYIPEVRYNVLPRVK